MGAQECFKTSKVMMETWSNALLPVSKPATYSSVFVLYPQSQAMDTYYAFVVLGKLLFNR